MIIFEKKSEKEWALFIIMILLSAQSGYLFPFETSRLLNLAGDNGLNVIYFLMYLPLILMGIVPPLLFTNEDSHFKKVRLVTCIIFFLVGLALYFSAGLT